MFNINLQYVKHVDVDIYCNASINVGMDFFRGTVVRWHSFQKTRHRPNSLIGQMIGSLTVGQLLVLRKLALLKLTAIMERYCPTHRTGWNWELPKFMRKTKTLDSKGTQVTNN